MRTHNIHRAAPRSIGATFIGANTTTSDLRSASIHLLNSPTGHEGHRNLARCAPMPPTLRNETTEILADIDGIPILVRVLVKDIPAEVQSRYVSKGGELHSLLSRTLKMAVDRLRGSSQQSVTP